MSQSDSSTDTGETKRPKFSMDQSYVDDIKKLVDEGPYSSGSEVVRTAVHKLKQEHFEDGGPWFNSLVKLAVQINDKVSNIEETVDEILDYLSSYTHSGDKSIQSGDSQSEHHVRLIDVQDDIYKVVDTTEPVTFVELTGKFDYTSLEIHDAIQELLLDEYIVEIERDNGREYKINRDQ